MVKLMLESELAGSPLPAYTRIQDFIAKVRFAFFSIFFLFYSLILLNYSICFVSVLISFFWQVGAGRTRVNNHSDVHKGLDLLFADIPENLPVPNISTDVPAWNKLPDSYFECLFAFANSNLHDDGVLVLVHCASPSFAKSIYDWANTYEFYIAEDWFGMNELDLQSPVVPTGVVLYLIPPLLFFNIHIQFLFILGHCFLISTFLFVF